MEIVLSILVGYTLGCISPSAFIAKLKSKSLRDNGTGNLGATNTMIVFGKVYGIAVMIFDIAKAYAAVKISELCFPELAAAGILAGTFAVMGHIFPFYMKFKGGKGLASFGGMILALDPLIFLILLIITLTLMFIINYSVAMPMSAAILFPVMYGYRTEWNIWAVLISALVCLVLFLKHIEHIQRIKDGKDSKIRDYIKEHFLH